MANRPQYDDGLELAPYQSSGVNDDGGKEIYRNPGMQAQDDYGGMAVNEYGGMAVNEYQAGRGTPRSTVFSDDASGKAAFHAGGQIYEEDIRSRLRRDLKTRQISMIALGGALGTGLLINTCVFSTSIWNLVLIASGDHIWRSQDLFLC